MINTYYLINILKQTHNLKTMGTQLSHLSPSRSSKTSSTPIYHYDFVYAHTKHTIISRNDKVNHKKRASTFVIIIFRNHIVSVHDYQLFRSQQRFHHDDKKFKGITSSSRTINLSVNIVIKTSTSRRHHDLVTVVVPHNHIVPKKTNATKIKEGYQFLFKWYTFNNGLINWVPYDVDLYVEGIAVFDRGINTIS